MFDTSFSFIAFSLQNIFWPVVSPAFFLVARNKADKALKAVEVLRAEMPDDWWALGSEAGGIPVHPRAAG